MAELETRGKVTLPLAEGSVDLDSTDLQIRLQAKEGWAAAHGPAAVVVLSTELTPELVTEGWARELVHAVQNRRKDIDCGYTDRIAVGVVTESAEIQQAIRSFGDYIRSETLAVELQVGTLEGAEGTELTIAGVPLTLYVKRLPAAGEGSRP